METAAGFVGGIVEFTSGVEGCKYKSFGRHAFFVHTDRDAAAVILYGGRAVFVQSDAYFITESGQMFIDRIVNKLDGSDLFGKHFRCTFPDVSGQLPGLPERKYCPHHNDLLVP